MISDNRSRSLANYPTDILSKVVGDYAADEVGQVHLLLEAMSTDPLAAPFGADHLARCALFLAQGSVARLRDLVKLGRQDAGSLIVAAEHDGELPVRDFRRAFKH